MGARAKIDPYSPVFLARQKCWLCGGRGHLWKYRQSETLCRCVYRTVFSLCLARFHEFAFDPACLGGDYDYAIAAEFRADFLIAARRVLDNFELQVLEKYWIDGGAYTQIDRVNRGQLFHTAYRVAEKMGRALLDKLFPISRYLPRPRIAKSEALWTAEAWGGREIFEVTSYQGGDPFPELRKPRSRGLSPGKRAA